MSLITLSPQHSHCHAGRLHSTMECAAELQVQKEGVVQGPCARRKDGVGWVVYLQEMAPKWQTSSEETKRIYVFGISA